MKGISTIILLALSNSFMTLAWYGHLKFATNEWVAKWGIISLVLISWGIAFFEYLLQIPANRFGFHENGGPFTLLQLKVIQEVISIIVFIGFTLIAFKNESFRWNHAFAFICLILAVYFVFKK